MSAPMDIYVNLYFRLIEETRSVKKFVSRKYHVIIIINHYHQRINESSIIIIYYYCYYSTP